MPDFYSKIYDEMYRNGYKKDKNASQAADLCSWILSNNTISFNSVLDAGCGNGAAVTYMKKKGKSASGFDVSSEAVSLAARLGHKNCITASVLQLPYKDNSFDLVMSADMFEHLKEQDVPVAINEIKRVSSKYLAIKVATKPSGDKENYINIEKFGIKNLHLTIRDISWWVNSFLTAGLKVLEVNNQTILSEK